MLETNIVFHIVCLFSKFQMLLIMNLATIRSNTLNIVDVSAIGLKCSGSVGVLIFGIGFIFADFHSDGTKLCWMQWLKSVAKMSDSSRRALFRSREGIEFGPGAQWESLPKVSSMF